MQRKESQPIKILFICLGNICRSPLAEGIFRHLCRIDSVLEHFHIESAGTGSWHCGNPPDLRSLEVALKYGIRLESVCRQVNKQDLESFDLVLAMDRANLKDLMTLAPKNTKTKIRLLREYDTHRDNGLDVPDPYYGGKEGFENVFQILDRCCRKLLLDLCPHLPPLQAGKK